MKITLKYGIAVTAAIAAWVALKHFVLHFESSSAQIVDLLIFNLAAITGLMFGIKEKRRMNDGTLVFGDGLITGIKIAVTYAVLTSAYFAALLIVVGPKIMQQEGDTNVVKAFAGVSIGFAILGTMLSSIISVILKRPYRAQGVDGWLLLFVVVQLVLRPIQAVNMLGSPDGANESQIADRFPVAANIMSIERIVVVGLVIVGVFVAFALLRTGHQWPVVFAKIYLIANPLMAIVLPILYYTSDLPANAKSQLIPQQIVIVIVSGVLSGIWFAYFTKSKRVRATYYDSNSSIAEPA
jgi:hypothetical protein